MTDETGKPPPLMGSDNRKYLAYVFGSRDGSIAGVANRFDRQRLQARIRFQNRSVVNWRRELYFDAGSPDGSLERVPTKQRDAVLLEIHHNFADIQAKCRELIERPALLRSMMDGLLDPFKES